MEQKELQEWVEKISLEYFKQPFLHQAIFNTRLRTTGGRYHLQDHHLDFNAKMLMEHGEIVFEGIIKHELCHYHLHLTGKGYRHQDHDFKKLLAQVDGLRYVPTPHQSLVAQQQHFWLYECTSCQTSFRRKRRVNTKKYVCGRCKGKLILKNTIRD